jgi:hypothetical protein
MREASYLETARPQESEARTLPRTRPVMHEASYPEIYAAFHVDHSVRHSRTHQRTSQTVESMHEASYSFQELVSSSGARYKLPTSIEDNLRTRHKTNLNTCACRGTVCVCVCVGVCVCVCWCVCCTRRLALTLAMICLICLVTGVLLPSPHCCAAIPSPPSYPSKLQKRERERFSITGGLGRRLGLRPG